MENVSKYLLLSDAKMHVRVIWMRAHMYNPIHVQIHVVECWQLRIRNAHSVIQLKLMMKFRVMKFIIIIIYYNLIAITHFYLCHGSLAVDQKLTFRLKTIGKNKEISIYQLSAGCNRVTHAAPR